MFNPWASFCDIIEVAAPLIETEFGYASGYISTFYEIWNAEDYPAIVAYPLSEGGFDKLRHLQFDLIHVEVWTNNNDSETNRKIRESLLFKHFKISQEYNIPLSYPPLKNYKLNESTPNNINLMLLELYGAEGWRIVPENDPTVRHAVSTLKLLYNRAGK